MPRVIRILIVDDNRDDRELASRALRHEFSDLEIVEVNDEFSLRAALEGASFDLVITDFQLLWTDGLAVLRRVQERSPNVPVIMYTNTGTEEVAVEGMKLGLSDYVLKRPRQIERLAVAARNALHFAATRLELAQRQEEIRRHEQQLAELLEREKLARFEAEQANRLKDEFIATISHELRTPLNAMLGWIQLLRMGGVPPEDVEEAHNIIERNVRAQARLVEDLLDLNRISSGQIRLEVQSVDLPGIIRSAVQAIEPSANMKGLSVRVMLDPAAGPVHGDPTRLQQVAWNLLNNAVKFTEPGNWVQVRLERVGSHVELLVADNGVGIEPAFLKHIFDRFRQADASTTRRYGGLGIGLAIVKNLVELHGGRVSAHSEGIGQGATFKVHLPLAALATEAPRPQPHPTSDQGSAAPLILSLVGLRILAVDDDPDACALISRALSNAGASVVCASSAQEGMDHLMEQRFDLLLSDIGMPGEDGFQFIARVRELEHASTMPAAALTAFARSEDRQRVLLAGFQSHIAKPVEPNELLAVVSNLTQLAQGRGKLAEAKE